MGDNVYLIERENKIGGKLASLGKVFPGNITGEDMIARLNEEVKNEDRITLLTSTKIKECSGNIGDFRIRLQDNIERENRLFQNVKSMSVQYSLQPGLNHIPHPRENTDIRD